MKAGAKRTDIMAAEVVVLAGPAGTGKTAQALAQYQQVGSGGEPGRALWIAPNWRAVEEVRRRVLSHRVGYLAPGIMTFDRFAEAVVEFSGERARLLDRWMQRWLIWQLVEEGRQAGKFRYFSQIAHTIGFIDMLCAWIQEMKRLEIWPEQFRQACQAKGLTDKDQELLEIYQAYQHLLTEHDLYDAEGRFWLARTLLANGALLPPAQRQSLKLVVVDGFTDFTRTQHEILEHLARRADCLLITLPLEKAPGREELFAKPRKTLQELWRRHQRVRLQWLARPGKPAWPALAHVEQHLFANPRHYRPLGQKAEGIEILAAATPLAEVQLLAKRIKQLLTQKPPGGKEPVRPDDILVLFRSLEPVAGLVREVFSRYGIPFALEAAEPLRSARSLLALVDLMRLQMEDWPFRQLLAVLNHSYFQPPWAEWQKGRAGLIAEQILRRLQIPQGREQLFQSLEELARLEDPQAKKAQTTLAVLKRLAQALDLLPERATLSEWAKAWKELAYQVGILQAGQNRDGSGVQVDVGSLAASPSEPSGQASRELLAWQQLDELVQSADRLWSWLGRPAAQLQPQQALNVLTDLLQGVSLPFRTQEAGRVRVLSVRTARALHAPYVFLAGLSEKSFPVPEPADRFYSEQETHQLIREKLPLSLRQDQTCEEMLLFYEAITRAGRQLVLSYPGLDESAQPLASSPYLDELEAVCGPGQIERKELFELRPVPAGEELFCPRDFRVRGMAEAMEGKVELLAGLVEAQTGANLLGPSHLKALSPSSAKSRSQPSGPSLVELLGPEVEEIGCAAEEIFTMAQNLLAAVRLMADRSDPDQFGPGEGILQTPAILARLQKEFSAEYVYSATGLEHYATCPFQFLLEEVLGLKPAEELELEEDSAERGRLTHQILAEVHRRLNDRLGRPASPTELEEADWESLLNQVLEQTFAHKPAQPVQAAMQELHRRCIRQWLAEYRSQCQKYDQDTKWTNFSHKPKPTYFEVAFGSSDPTSRYAPLELSLPAPSAQEPTKVRISGRIDRIDLGQADDQTLLFNILDYKTGRASWPSRTRGRKTALQQLQQGTHLQLPLYLLAAQQVILADQQAQPCFAAYWKIASPARTSPLSGFAAAKLEKGTLWPSQEWKEIQDITISTVFRLVRGIRSGQFPVWGAKADCTRNCPWKTACRIPQVRALKDPETLVLPGTA